MSRCVPELQEPMEEDNEEENQADVDTDTEQVTSDHFHMVSPGTQFA